jgi:acetoin utilization deacetylase AcuC-like enzyme
VDADDTDKVMFASLHLSAVNFYPRMARQDYFPGNSDNAFELLSSGKESDNDPKYPNIINIPLGKTSSKAESAAIFRAAVEQVVRAEGSEVRGQESGLQVSEPDVWLYAAREQAFKCGRFA